MKSNHIFIIAGPSGVGKDTIINAILDKNPDFASIPTYTTRPPREDDEQNRNRISIDKAVFDNLIKNHQLIDYKETHGNLYGKKITDAQKALGENKNLILEIDTKGLLDYQKQFPNLCAIFIQYENLDKLKKRLLKNRPGVSKEDINRRYHTALEEMKNVSRYDYVVTNYEGHPEKAVAKVEQIILKTLAKKP